MTEPDMAQGFTGECEAAVRCSRRAGSELQHGRVLAFQRTTRDETAERHDGVWRSHMAR